MGLENSQNKTSGNVFLLPRELEKNIIKDLKITFKAKMCYESRM